jgi:hypothetical protein
MRCITYKIYVQLTSYGRINWFFCAYRRYRFSQYLTDVSRQMELWQHSITHIYIYIYVLPCLMYRSQFDICVLALTKSAKVETFLNKKFHWRFAGYYIRFNDIRNLRSKFRGVWGQNQIHMRKILWNVNIKFCRNTWYNIQKEIFRYANNVSFCGVRVVDTKRSRNKTINHWTYPLLEESEGLTFLPTESAAGRSLSMHLPSPWRHYYFPTSL